MLKVQIGVRLTPLSNYLNIDLAAKPNEQDRVLGDVFKLDPLIDANECSEIILCDTLDYLHVQARAQALQHVLTRIAHGGKIIIMGNDVYEVSRLVHNGQLDLQQANNIVYGMGRKGFVRPLDNVAVANTTGQFTLDSVKYQPNGFSYVVILVRR